MPTRSLFGPRFAEYLKGTWNYVSNIFAKLHVADRAQAIIQCLRGRAGMRRLITIRPAVNITLP